MTTDFGNPSPNSGPLSEEQIRNVTVGEPTIHGGEIHIAEYDPAWALSFTESADRIRNVLGERPISVEHVGSTSVPGLASKPILDLLLIVENSAEESSYLPFLESIGYVLRIREPNWHEHRMLKGFTPATNLHVFSRGSSEVERMLRFRNWLRNHPEDRELYERTKRDLARREWKYVQNYADAKSQVVEEILTRALSTEQHE